MSEDVGGSGLWGWCRFERWEKVVIEEERVVYQVHKVLRMWVGDVIAIQPWLKIEWSDDSKIWREVMRYQIRLEEFSKKRLVGEVLACEKKDSSVAKNHVTMLLAMPNHSKKMSLIVQKLTEVGVDEVVFRWSQYSQLSIDGDIWMKHINKWKEKLWKVALEAMEQSKGWVIPQVNFVSDLLWWMGWRGDDALVIFDKVENDVGLIDSLSSLTRWWWRSVCWCIGPEWGFGLRDWEIFSWVAFEKISLGESILRMETAAIVGGWVLKQM